MRFLWLQKTEPNRPWAAFQIQVHHAVKAFFRVPIVLEVGNGKNIIFWTDRWVHGQSLDQLVPNLFGSINNKARKRKCLKPLMRWNGCRTYGASVLQYPCWENLWRCGIFSQILLCSLKLMIPIYGNSLVRECTLPDMYMRDFLLGPYSLDLARESRGDGHQANASSSCG